MFIYPHGRASGIFVVLAFYKQSATRRVGRGARVSAGGRRPWGGAAAARFCMANAAGFFAALDMLRCCRRPETGPSEASTV